MQPNLSENKVSWFDEFLNTPFAESTIRKIEADYMSRLRQHVEEQQNSGKFSSVEGALNDFSKRLNLGALERRVLAGLVKKAQVDLYSPEKMKKEMVEQGAPLSILPGVKPNKITNKQKVNTEIAEEGGTEATPQGAGASTPSLKSVSSMTPDITGGVVSPDKFEFTIDQQGFYLKFVAERLSELEVRYSLIQKKGTLGDSVVEHPRIVQNLFDNIVRGLVSKDKANEATYKEEFDAFKNWLAAPFLSSKPIEKKPLSLKNIPLGESEEKAFVSDNLEDVELPEGFAKPAKISLTDKEQDEEPVEVIEGEPVKSLKGLPLNTEFKQKEMSALGIVATTFENLDKDYQDSKKQYEAVSTKLSQLNRLRLHTLHASSALRVFLNAQKANMSMDQYLDAARERLDNALADPEVNPESIPALEQNVATIERAAKIFKQITTKEGINPETAEGKEKLEALIDKYRDSRQKLQGLIASTTKEEEEAEQLTLFYQGENDLAKLAKTLSAKLRKGASEEEISAKIESALQSVKNKEQFLNDFAKTFGPKPNRNQLRFLQRLGDLFPEWDSSDVSEETKEGKRAEITNTLKVVLKNSAFLGFSSDTLQQIYEQEVATSQAGIERRKNQVRVEDVEYVQSLVSDKKYEGYLPETELLKAADLLTGAATIQSDESAYRSKAIAFAENARAQAMLELEKIEKGFNKRLQKAVTKEEREQVLAKGRELLPPNLRAYLLDPKLSMEQALAPSDIERIVLSEIIPASGKSLLGDEEVTQLDASSREDFLNKLRKIAIIKGYALESYDVTIADYTNRVLTEQCSNVVNHFTRQINGRDVLAVKALNKGSLSARKAFVFDVDKDGELEKKQPNIPQWFKEPFNKLEIEYAIILEQEIAKYFETVASKESGVKQIALNPTDKKATRNNEILKAVHRQILALLEKDIQQNPAAFVGTDSAQAESMIALFKERFVKSLEGRKAKDNAVIEHRLQQKNFEKVARACAFLFGDATKAEGYQAVVPTSAKRVRLTPKLIRDQIYEVADSLGKQMDEFTANKLLANAFEAFYMKGMTRDLEGAASEEQLKARRETIRELVTIFPTTPEAKKQLLDTYRETLVAETQAAIDAGAVGALLGIEPTYYIFNALPEGDLTEAPLPKKVKQRATPFSFQTETTVRPLSGLQGTKEQISAQLEAFKQAEYNVHIKMFSAAQSLEDNVSPIIESVVTDEVTHRFSKLMYAGVAKELTFSLDQLGLTPEEATSLWNESIVQEINRLNLPSLPGAPRSKWGKGSANFIANGNSWKIGQKRSIYEANRTWAERFFDEKTSSEERTSKNKRALETVRKQKNSLSSFLSFIASYSEEVRATLPPMKVFFPKKTLPSSLVNKLDYLLQVYVGKVKTDKLSPEEANERLLSFIRKTMEELTEKQLSLSQNGKNKVNIELTCPVAHANPTNNHIVTYITGRPNTALFGRANEFEQEAHVPWNRWINKGLAATSEERTEIEEWAESVVSGQADDEDKSMAARFKQDRFVLIGGYPKCPVCGFVFKHVDREISDSLKREPVGLTTKTLAGLLGKEAQYVVKLSLEEARKSYDWIIRALVWLEHPDTANVTRAEAEKQTATATGIKIGLGEIEALPITRVDQGRFANVQADQKNEKSDSLFGLIREVLTGDATLDQDLETRKGQPRLLWQVQLADILDIWKKHLKMGFGFGHEFTGLTAQKMISGIESKTIVIKEPLFRKQDDVACVGYEGNNPIVFEDTEDAQLQYFIGHGKKPGEFAPVGHKPGVHSSWKSAREILRLLAPGSEQALQEYLSNKLTEQGKSKLIDELIPADGYTAIHEEDRKLLGQALKEASAGNRESLKKALQTLFPTLEPDTDLVALGAKGEASLSTAYAYRLARIDIDSIRQSFVEQAERSLSENKPFINSEITKERLDRFGSFYEQLSEAHAVAAAKELEQGWLWLQNRVIRVASKEKRGRVAVKFDSQSFEDLKALFKKNTFPTQEKIKSLLPSKYAELDIEEEDFETLTHNGDILLAIVKNMLIELDGGVAGSTTIGGVRSSLVKEFLANLGAKVPQDKQAIFSAKADALRQFLTKADNRSDYDSAKEISTNVRAILGLKGVGNAGVADPLVEKFSEAIADLNQKCTELAEIRSTLMRESYTFEQPRKKTEEKNQPDPRFFYRVTHVTGLINKPLTPSVVFTKTVTSPSGVKTTERESYSMAEMLSRLTSLEKDLIGGDLSKQGEYKECLQRYLSKKIKRRYTPGPIKLVLTPVVTTSDVYEASALDSREEVGVVHVPEEALRSAEYKLPAEMRDNPPSSFATREELQKAFVEIYSRYVEFASVQGAIKDAVEENEKTAELESVRRFARLLDIEGIKGRFRRI